jgi:hypothetical protein
MTASPPAFFTLFKIDNLSIEWWAEFRRNRARFRYDRSFLQERAPEGYESVSLAFALAKNMRESILRVSLGRALG